jgi:ATP-dependent helicase HrpB
LATQAVLEAIADEGQFLLDWNEQTLLLLARINSLKTWNPTQDWPEWTVATLCQEASQWLEPYLVGITRNEDFKKLNLSQLLHQHLSFEQQQLLERLAPAALTVPSGSQITITYQEDGSPPLLSARLQELFGLVETPKVNEGKVSLLIALLSPGYKPVQLTQDLKSFWASGYFEVKKELKRRYPKHEWPEDPLKAEAVRGVKKRF